MQRWEVIEISGDAGIKAYGRDCKETFANVALGMYALVSDHQNIQAQRSRHITISAASIDSLLVDFLNELVFLMDTEGFIGCRIEFIEFFNDSSFSLSADIYGEIFDASRHQRRLLIKAATYHKLKIEQNSRGCVIEVIFDI